MDYFDLNALKQYYSAADEEYETNSDATRCFFDTRTKLEYLVGELGKSLKEDFVINYSEKPNKRAGQGRPAVLKEYILTGFVPRRHETVDKDVFIKLAFEHFEAGKADFLIEADTNFKDPDNRFNADRDKLLRDTTYDMYVDDTFPTKWEDLIEEIKPEVKKAVDYLDQYLGLKKGDPEKPNDPAKPKEKSDPPSARIYPLNQILYGPPGTGKTYQTINRALAIVGENMEGKGRKEIKNAFDEKVKEGRIVFTTFHQSMSYEDFIEGIKPLPPDKEEGNVIYKVIPGILKQLAQEAWKSNEEKIKIAADSEDLTEELFTAIYRQFADTLNETGSEYSNCILETKEGYKFKLFKNGAGSIAVKAGEEKANLIVSVNELIKVHFYKKVPAYQSYEPVIIKKILADKSYTVVSTDNRRKPYVLIIDEINRGNVSQIFGELITLIEDDKRLTRDEALEVVLPYSKEPFGVPPNLYIIGTMNTADRSIEALDTALRRRFSIEEVPPDAEVIAREGRLKESNGILQDINLPLLLNKINRRIEKLLDRDHHIGHGYLMSVINLADLKAVFQNRILPLLQEYFFGDYGKIGLVVGKGFFEDSEENGDVVFADFDYDASRLSDKTVYKLKDMNDIDDDAFIRAVHLLMGK